MAIIHVSEAEAARDFVALMDRVRAGAEVVIESESHPVAMLTPMRPAGRKISEAIALLSKDSDATIDEDFAKDVAAAVEFHREPSNPSTWD
jgi:antitoxin (DNA-binding transcriptional repressor) of toxin-antitoxin stability system